MVDPADSGGPGDGQTPQGHASDPTRGGGRTALLHSGASLLHQSESFWLTLVQVKPECGFFFNWAERETMFWPREWLSLGMDAEGSVACPEGVYCDLLGVG